MLSHITRAVAVLCALAAALFLSSCSGSETHENHATSDAPAITGEPAAFDQEDVAFATNMIPHHQQAIDLATLASERSTNEEVRTLASQIAAAQQPEINALRVFLVQWNENPEDGTGHGGEGHNEMHGMIDDATMTKLRSLSGAEFDTLWLQSMIGHHEGAIEMAKAEIADGTNVDIKRMAQTIIDTQQAEVDQMNQMLKGGQHG
jgi:uncharacterized protein (DUF305 family)